MILQGNALTRAQPAIRDEEIVSRFLRLPSGERKISFIRDRAGKPSRKGLSFDA